MAITMDRKEWEVQILLEYVALSNAELEAADLAATRAARIAHLEQAYRYARLAVEERAKQSSIFQWSQDLSRVRPLTGEEATLT